MLQEQEEDKLITALQREGGAIHSSVIHRLSHYVHCEHMDNQHHRANPQKKNMSHQRLSEILFSRIWKSRTMSSMTNGKQTLPPPLPQLYTANAINIEFCEANHKLYI